VSSVYCVGRNYADHAREMGAVPAADGEPVVFLKPWSSLLASPGSIRLPPGVHEVHHEAELVIRTGPDGAAAAVALGLDLTDRARQAKAKEAGLPWATAKGFRTSACVGPFVPVSQAPRLDALRFALSVNGDVRQRGDTSLLLRPVPRLLRELHRWFGLVEGDLVFTGTPAGVGPIRAGDVLDLELEGVPAAAARFVVAD
jgi:2-keto-4-pentenoate hydratase/2-oxohepta-3-ene-1,7-dioic acid hydratase in catechol pathway